MAVRAAKIKCLIYVKSVLRKLDRAIFEAYETALTQLDRALMYVENDLEQTRKEKLR